MYMEPNLIKHPREGPTEERCRHKGATLLGTVFGRVLRVHMNMLEHWTVATIGVIDFMDGSQHSVAKIDQK